MRSPSAMWRRWSARLWTSRASWWKLPGESSAEWYYMIHIYI
jgi:hypothetical protein